MTGGTLLSLQAGAASATSTGYVLGVTNTSTGWALAATGTSYFNGFVGIGTTAPGAPLDVESSATGLTGYFINNNGYTGSTGLKGVTASGYLVVKIRRMVPGKTAVGGLNLPT
jgi:hypothetical protein